MLVIIFCGIMIMGLGLFSLLPVLVSLFNALHKDDGATYMAGIITVVYTLIAMFYMTKEIITYW